MSSSKYINNVNNLPCPTRTFHRDTYDAIDPTQSSLSLNGKKIIITGGGSGIGRETVRSFASAGASQIYLLGGRRAELLEETKKIVQGEFPKLDIECRAVDITRKEDVGKAVGELGVGGWDVLVLNSAYLSNTGPLSEVDVDDWWKAFEVALKGTLILLQALLPKRNTNASVLATSSLVINYQYPGVSSYIVSKLAFTRMMECLAQENEDLFVVAFHPGGVETPMFHKFFGEGAEAHMAARGTDTLKLPADFAVWLASPEAKFLRGRFVYANWDVPELKKVCDERFKSEPDFLKANVIGWPFEPPAAA